MSEQIIVSKFEWYFTRILATLILCVFYCLGMSFVLCMLNAGNWIDSNNYWDDNIIGIFVLVISAVLSWISSSRVVKAFDKLTSPFCKIIYKHEEEK